VVGVPGAKFSWSDGGVAAERVRTIDFPRCGRLASPATAEADLAEAGEDVSRAGGERASRERWNCGSEWVKGAPQCVERVDQRSRSCLS
jgi:hypothetical protein